MASSSSSSVAAAEAVAVTAAAPQGRGVWLETSNAFVAQDGRFGSFVSGPTQREGGHLITAGAQHWIITVGTRKYQAGCNQDGMNWGSSDQANKSMVGCTKCGTTVKTDAEIEEWLVYWNKDLGGKTEYNLLSNSCQTFATHLVRWLCDGNGNLPNAGGFSMTMDRKNFNVSAGMGEVACASYNGAKAAASGPAVGFQGVKGEGAFLKAEAAKAELGADTQFGRVGVVWSPNVNTGVGVRDGNAEASVLGFGGKVGKDGVGVRTPLGGADCVLM